jgi:hypothetical protein
MSTECCRGYVHIIKDFICPEKIPSQRSREERRDEEIVRKKAESEKSLEPPPKFPGAVEIIPLVDALSVNSKAIVWPAPTALSNVLPGLSKTISKSFFA